MISPPCPLCLYHDSDAFHVDRKRPYLRCRQCGLVHVPPEFYPDKAIEKAEYDLHQNDLEDPGYRRFLSRLATPLLNKLAQPGCGLDYGCGPGPALASMFREEGHDMALYDPFYYPDSQTLKREYDFITCSEAIEHFHSPYQEWQTWMRILKPGGWLAIMTKRVLDKEKFATWHYKNDKTHVCFFSVQTFDWLAEKHNLRAEYFGSDVVLLQST